MEDWKNKFIIYALIAVMLVAFILIVTGLDNKSQPSVEDVMTNNATTIEDILE